MNIWQILILFAGAFLVVQFLTPLPPVAEQESTLMQTARDIDKWVADEGWKPETFVETIVAMVVPIGTVIVFTGAGVFLVRNRRKK